MDTIDISSNIADFKQVFEAESRIIFSAKFGDGKSYFLKKFMESYPKEANEYYFITLHPVNYVVEENKDVIEYIKRDILFQLLKDGKIYDYTGEDDKIFNAVCNRESFSRLVDFLACIAPIDGLKDGIDNVKKLLGTVKDKYDEQNDIIMADDYLNGFYGLKGSISECDAFTCLIQKTLEHHLAKSVLIIEDLDRIDPAHLFRIMNVLSSQVDNPYYADCNNGNKFGFDKIILVMDYDITKHIFHHFYGKEANYEGYMNKFLNTVPFKFSILEEAQKQVEKKLEKMFGTNEILNFHGVLNPKAVEPISFSMIKFVKSLSVRRCKDFLDDDVDMHIKADWNKKSIKIPTRIKFTRLLYCLKYFIGFNTDEIFELLVNNLRGELGVRIYLPLFRNGYHRDSFYVKTNKETFICQYVISDNKEEVIPVGTPEQEDTLIEFNKLKEAVVRMKYDIIELLIG